MKRKTGATGNFPSGQIGPQDKGELRVAISLDPNTNRIHMDLGPAPVKWISMTASEALVFADVLQKKARKLEALNDKAPRCRVCGCTEDKACPGGCAWAATPDAEGLGVCSRCAEWETWDLVEVVT